MAIYLKKFENHTQYETYTASTEFITPNVSLCEQENEVHYNPYVEPPETRVVAKFNVTSTSSPTSIARGTSNFSAIEIDGVQTSVVTGYTFDTIGEHIVKYTLTNPTSVGNQAFQSCSSLTSIVIPSGVTSIGGNAFRDCSSLTRLNSDVDGVFNIPNSVTSIGSGVFYNCTSLTSIDIPSGVTSIGNNAFQECTSLTSIGIPNSVTSIAYNAFYNCTSLTSIDIPSGVTIIGRSAFQSCSSLTSIVIPSGVTSIGDTVFASCTSLTSIVIPSGVTSIGASAFYYCDSLTSCTIPSGVTSIGNHAFYGCGSLTSATINATTPPTLGQEAFHGTANELKIYVPSGSVDAYKAASHWSNYASIIKPIA